MSILQCSGKQSLLYPFPHIRSLFSPFLGFIRVRGGAQVHLPNSGSQSSLAPFWKTRVPLKELTVSQTNAILSTVDYKFVKISIKHLRQKSDSLREAMSLLRRLSGLKQVPVNLDRWRLALCTPRSLQSQLSWFPLK